MEHLNMNPVKPLIAYEVTENKPAIGIYSLNGLQWIYEEMEKGIDIDFEDYCRNECPQREKVYPDCNCDFEPCESIYLIGYVYDEKLNTYEPDPNAEMIAECGGTLNCAWIIRSSWTVNGHIGSPCIYPNVDGDTPGNLLCYAPPPDIVGDINPELKNRIKPI